jgi:uncharacterized SAM-binding protein YcdF (DUF218 family)
MWFLFITFGIFWIFSTPVVSSHIVASLEQKFLPVPVDKSPTADAIVVLGGSLVGPKSPRIDIELTENSDRIPRMLLGSTAQERPLSSSQQAVQRIFNQRLMR